MARAARMALDLALAASKAVRPVAGIAWQYGKTELVPPGTIAFFNGAGGKYLETTVSKVTDGVISTMQETINAIDESAAAAIKKKEDKIKAEHAKALADAAKAAEETKKQKETKIAAEALKVKEKEASQGKEKKSVPAPTTKKEPPQK